MSQRYYVVYGGSAFRSTEGAQVRGVLGCQPDAVQAVRIAQRTYDGVWALFSYRNADGVLVDERLEYGAGLPKGHLASPERRTRSLPLSRTVRSIASTSARRSRR